MVGSGVIIEKRRTIMTLNKLDELVRIKAMGNMLQNYHSDLRYILNFQRHKQNKPQSGDYLQISPGSFQSFLNEFRIARNVYKENVRKLLDQTKKWIKQSDADDVDDVDAFAEELKLKGVTLEGKTMTSLASKILFLNNPWKIIPLDTLNKKALNVRTNLYNEFYEAVQKKREALLINGPFSPVQEYFETIEKEFKNDLKNIHIIRENRYLDKMLWVQGQNNIIREG
jgi:hypothetical protein